MGILPVFFDFVVIFFLIIDLFDRWRKHKQGEKQEEGEGEADST